MTINPSAQPHDVYDILDGSVSEYFQLVDDCIRPNEEINGQYRVTTTACYSQDCPLPVILKTAPYKHLRSLMSIFL